MIVAATYEHILHVINNMRQCDLTAMRAAYGDLSNAQYAINRYAGEGVKFALLHKGRAVAVGGVDELGDFAVLWLIATDEWLPALREAYRAMRNAIEVILDAGYERVFAYVLEGFDPGCALVEKLGFRLSKIRPKVGKNGESFVEYLRSAHA